MFQKIVARGVDPQKIIAGAQKYSRFHEPNSQFIPMASTWLNRQGWIDHDEQEQSPISADEAARLIEKYRQRRLREGWS